jgi:uncharacterized protein YcgL (UPF0745 family)
MLVDIYRPSNRTDLYLFVSTGADPMQVPSDVHTQFGQLVFLKSREIIPGHKLIGANTDEILQNISRAGFHVQGVGVAAQVSEGGAALGGGILGASVAGPVGALVGAFLGYALAEHAKKVSDEL